MTKVDIISGFLGAGKTTLIKKLIREVYNGEKIVLIENEFGEVGVDGGFLKDAGIEISEMNSGCICCSLVGDFGVNLRKVIKQFSPERILIEPSGVSKLSDVKKAIEEVKQEQEIEINSLITVANAKKALKQMRGFGEFFYNQIEYANTIFLSRTQNVESSEINKLVKTLKEKNKDATIVTTPWEDITGDKIKEAICVNASFEQELLKEQKSECGCHGEHHHGENEECGCHGEHHHGENEECGCHDHNHEAEEIFTSWGLETPRKYTKKQIEEIMQLFCNTENYGAIIRAKGILDSDEEQWIYFDFVDGDYEIRTGNADYTGKICVIGTQLNQDKLNSLFLG